MQLQITDETKLTCTTAWKTTWVKPCKTTDMQCLWNNKNRQRECIQTPETKTSLDTQRLLIALNHPECECVLVLRHGHWHKLIEKDYQHLKCESGEEWRRSAGWQSAAANSRKQKHLGHSMAAQTRWTGHILQHDWLSTVGHKPATV